jgi:hypothetical protein
MNNVDTIPNEYFCINAEYSLELLLQRKRNEDALWLSKSAAFYCCSDITWYFMSFPGHKSITKHMLSGR